MTIVKILIECLFQDRINSRKKTICHFLLE
nr:MAG TPA: hypothetical protein [Crassvirales sp.]